MSDTNICGCQCHAGPYHACSVVGGCGSTGCGRANTRRTPTDGACSLCGIYRPDAEPRLPHRPPVCDGDRNLLDRHLVDIANLVADLSNPEPPIVERRRYERFGVEYLKNGERRTVSLGEVWKDPLAAVDGVGPINSRSKQPDVTGSRERPIPIPVNAVDLKAGARVPNSSTAAKLWPEDQVGYLSAATVLDQWVRDVRDTLFADQHLPQATVDQLVLWLRNRVDDICDRHTEVASFAEEIRSLRGVLRSAAGVIDPAPEPCDGVTCARCELRALYRRPGDTYRAECSTCGTLYSEDEYAVLIADQAKTERERRTPEDISALLRRA